MARGYVWVNGRDLHEFGFGVQTVEGLTDGLLLAPVAAPLAGRAGEMTLSDDVPSAPRTLTIRGTLRSSGGPQALIAQSRALESWLRRGPLALTTSHDIATEFHGGRLVGYAAPFDGPEAVARTAEVAATIRFDDPFAVERSPQVVQLMPDQPRPIPLWDAPTTGVVRVWGTGLVSVLYADAAGVVLGALQGPTLASNESWEADLGNLTMRIIRSNGSIENLEGNTTAGEWFTLNPAHGVPELDAWPTLLLIGGSISQGELLYRRRRIA